MDKRQTEDKPAAKRILLVEDEFITASDLKSELLKLGYEIPAMVNTGEEAIRKAADLLPDLILMDISLAGPMNGIEAAAEISKFLALPVIYLTAHADSETLEQAKITEPFGYLSKPCSTKALAATIEMALYKSEADAARRKIEDELKRVLAEQRIILENIGVGVLFLKARKIIWANPAITKMFGYTFSEMHDRDTGLFYPDRKSYLEIGEKAYAALGRGEIYTGQVQMQRKNGTALWCTLVGQAVNPACLEAGAIWIVADVTERRQMEEALLRSEEKYRTVADFTYDWEFWVGPDESILYCSPSCTRATGHAAAEFERNPSLQRQLVHPDDLAAYDQHRHGLKAGEESAELEYRIIRADGSTRWISHVCQPVFDRKGQFAGTRGNNRDVTERKSLEAEVARAHNLEALGILAGGIAHDFNNLFQGLLGNISLAQMYTPEASVAYKFLKKAEDSYAQAVKLTAQFVAFSSGGLSQWMDLQPADLIREAITSSLGGGSEVAAEFNFADDLCLVHVDPVQFRQVMKHLTINAMEAMPSGGRLRVTAVKETLTPEGAKTGALVAGNYLKISLQDQGSGISNEDLPRIFFPYFSTKQRGDQKGMGLGLSLCNTIIQKHGGAITVETEPGQGSTFHVRLPALVAAPQKTAARIEKSACRGHRILIMDDDAGVLQVTTEFLSFSGFRVDSALDGEAAITAYQEAREAEDPYAVVILDLQIPSGMGGKEVIVILKKIDPGVKAIVSSGYASDQAMTDFTGYGFVAACAKPYRFSEMIELLERFV